MTQPTDLPFDRDALEAMNAKAVQNQFFTPDHVYIDLALIKDIPLGVLYGDVLAKNDQALFDQVQASITEILSDYQVRRFDTVNPYLESLGYSDQAIDTILADNRCHDRFFIVSPTTSFFNTLIKHTIRNQNHSGPANKFIKKSIDQHQYRMDAMPVTYYINTYPFNLSVALLNTLAPELGEALGVNIRFINKDPMLFDNKDWKEWLKNIECFYLSSLGRFTRGDCVHQKQGDLEFAGKFFFARKRFETCVMAAAEKIDFDHHIQLMTARIDMTCDFAWLPNNDVRLTEDPILAPGTTEDDDQENGPPS